MKGTFIVCLVIVLVFSVICLFVEAQEASSDTLQTAGDDIHNELDEQMPIWLIDSTVSETQNSFAVASFAEVSDYVGQKLYYPTYGAQEPSSFISVIYSVKRYTVPAEKKHNTIQINIMGLIDYFWIDIGETKEIPFEAQDVAYEKNDTVFKIRKRESFDAPCGNYHVSGNLEGSFYTFYADTIEEAKAVIDGLTKQ